MNLMLENIKIALQSIRTNLIRTVLTIFIIAIGITALVGIQTAIESLKLPSATTLLVWVLIPLISEIKAHLLELVLKVLNQNATLPLAMKKL